MKRKTYKFIIFMLIILSYSYIINAKNLTIQSITSPNGRQYVGESYNLLTGTICNDALREDISVLEMEDKSYGDFFSRFIKNDYNLKRFLQKDFYSGQLNDYYGLNLTLDLHQVIMDSTNISSNTLTMIYSTYYMDKVVFVNGIHLKKEALDLLEQGRKDYFMFNFGNLYVHSAQLGAKMYIIYQGTITEDNTVSYNELVSAFKIKFDSIFRYISYDSDILHEAEQKLKNVKITSKVFSTGDFKFVSPLLNREDFLSVKQSFVNYYTTAKNFSVIKKTLQVYPSDNYEYLYEDFFIKLAQLEKWDEIKGDLEFMLKDSAQLSPGLVSEIEYALYNIVNTEIYKFTTNSETHFPNLVEFQSIYNNYNRERSIQLSKNITINTYSNFEQQFLLLNKNSDKYILSFYGRINDYKLSGASSILKIAVNGNVISETCLINKAQVRKYNIKEGKYKYTYINGIMENWYDEQKESWALFYASNMWENNVSGSVYGVIGGEATNYEFDITPYLTTGINTVELINTGTNGQTIVIEDFQILSTL